MTKLPTVEEVCKTFTKDQLILLNLVFTQPESLAADVVSTFVKYEVKFGEWRFSRRDLFDSHTKTG